MDITAGYDFLGPCGQKSSYIQVSNFGQLQSYGCLELKIEGKDYWELREQNNKQA
jgi:hypothetical protein